MRRLARELGVEAMTLYHHVQSKDALHDAIVEHVLSESIRDTSPSASWQEAVNGYAHDLHHGLLNHPGSVTLFATRPALTAQNLRALEGLLGILTGVGFAPATALHIVHATAVAVIGQHVTERDVAPESAIPESEDLPLVREALESGLSDLDSRLGFMLAALTVGYERLLEE